MPVRKYKPSDKEEEDYILKTAAPDMVSDIVAELKRTIKHVAEVKERIKEQEKILAERKAKKTEAKKTEEKKKKDDSSDDEETKREKRITKHKKDKEDKEAREKHYDETYDPDFEIPKDTVHIGKVINQKKKKIKKRQGVKSDSESESDSDNEVTHEFFETIEPEERKEESNEEKMQKKHHKYKYMGRTRDQAIQMFQNAQNKLNGTKSVKRKNIIYNDIYELNRYVGGLDGHISDDESDEAIEKKRDIIERMLAKNNPYLFYNFTPQGLKDIIRKSKFEHDEIRYLTPEANKKRDHLKEVIKEARRTLNAFKGDISEDDEPVKNISMSITHKKAPDKRASLKSDSDSDNEVIHEVFETLAPEMRLDMKTINKYYMSKTPEIKVPDKVIDVDNRGHLSLVNTLDSHGDINKVDGHKVLNVISYVPDNNKDSKIKVKQGKHSDLSKEVKKVEGKLKRSKKPATITKLNNELDELLKKLS